VAANWICENKNCPVPDFPAIGIVVSGGHTDLLLLEKRRTNGGGSEGQEMMLLEKLLIKAARILGLPYPGGPSIQKAIESNDKDILN